ncbi:hypothetical protein ACQRIT_003010 [Beauveria bassiana]
MNAFCVDFPEAPILESFRPSRSQDQLSKTQKTELEPEITFMTTEDIAIHACHLHEVAQLEGERQLASKVDRVGLHEREVEV